MKEKEEWTRDCNPERQDIVNGSLKLPVPGINKLLNKLESLAVTLLPVLRLQA